ncbi:MAG: hypothetical protein GX166_03455 [Clostridiaceae bacterium]|jgi:hypothetical protein|nr:hypothetical protein [Clostridiaceae bacterium]
MIEIKGVFSDWKEVEPEKAREYVKLIRKGMINLSDAEKNEEELENV